MALCIYSQNEQWDSFDRFRHVKTKDGKNMDLLVEFPKGHLTLIDGLSLSYITECTYIFIICKINWIFKKLYYVKWNIEEYLDYTIFLKIRKFMLCNSFLGPISLRNSTTQTFLPVLTKGQLISKCPFGVFKSSKKKTTKFFPGFLP